MPSFPLSPFTGFQRGTEQPPVTTTTVTPPLGQASGMQWNYQRPYGGFILGSHPGNNHPHLPDYYPKGLKVNLPNYWPVETNGYSNWITNNYKTEVYKRSNPYYIGSTTITNPVDSSLRPRMAAPLPKPNQALTTKDFRKITAHKVPVRHGESEYGQTISKRIGAQTYVGVHESKRTKELDGLGYSMLSSGINNSTNIELGNEAKRSAAILALNAATGFSGSPIAFQIGAAGIRALENESDRYATVPFKNLKRMPYEIYPDFRARKGWQDGAALNKRLDGVAAAARALIAKDGGNAVLPGAYAAASALIGGYSVINLEATYGFGEHGTPYSMRNDFSAKSAAASNWTNSGKGAWVAPKSLKDALQFVTPFRGDKVSIIDFRKTVSGKIYKWVPEKKPKKLLKEYNEFEAEVDKLTGRLTKDFIKFYFTGPALNPGNKSNADDVIVFRAILSSLTDSFNPSWSPVNFIGRADPSYNYGGYSRDINLDFTVYATDRDELKPIWRKLNALSGYTAPTYDGSSIALKGNYLRLTVGDIYYHQPIIINSLYYTLHDSETTWETNVLEEGDMMEVPKQINVSLGATLITDMVPQKDGKFFSLAKRFDNETSEAIDGNDNWLSGFRNNTSIKTIKGEE